MANTFIFRSNLDIGDLEAEKDAFLLQAFIDKGDMEVLRDTENPRCIIVGRTGAGKSALLKYLENQEHKVARVNPEAMSLRYLSNSDIIRYLNKLGTNLDLFYKVLWKHVFIIEFLKLHFGAEAYKENGPIAQFIERFTKSAAKRDALQYLRDFDGDFWEKAEVRVRTIETQVRTKLGKELNLAPEVLNKLISGTLHGEKEVVHLERQEIAFKAQKVISELQADSIYRVVEALKDDIFKDKQRRYFIVIDDLDKDWVDVTIVYDLIRALIVTINELKAIPGTKIVIALRDNLYEKALEQPKVRGIQREKFRQLNLNLEWNAGHLKELLNRRLATLMKYQYSNTSPTVDDVMVKASGGRLSGFDYIVRRTLFRPRDVIAFFNKCIEKANGSPTITRETLNLAEPEYSRERLEAVDDEWAENFGSILPLCAFLRGGLPSFTFGTLKDSDMELTLLAAVRDKDSAAFRIQQDYMIDGVPAFQIAARKILCILYRVGILGVKISPSEQARYVYNSTQLLEPSDITADTKFYVNLMFQAALKIDNKAAERGRT